MFRERKTEPHVARSFVVVVVVVVVVKMRNHDNNTHLSQFLSKIQKDTICRVCVREREILHTHTQQQQQFQFLIHTHIYMSTLFIF